MVTKDGKQSARESKETCQIAKPESKHKVSPLRKRMIRDMELAGFSPGTQQTYIGAVVKLQDHYHARPGSDRQPAQLGRQGLGRTDKAEIALPFPAPCSQADMEFLEGLSFRA